MARKSFESLREFKVILKANNRSMVELYFPQEGQGHRLFVLYTCDQVGDTVYYTVCT
jgi:hypothetical protein